MGPGEVEYMVEGWDRAPPPGRAGGDRWVRLEEGEEEDGNIMPGLWRERVSTLNIQMFLYQMFVVVITWPK